MHPDTSLYSSVIALCRFFIENYPHLSWYPEWYLGNPFRYLIGPVIPVLIYLIHLSGLSLSLAYVILIVSSFAFAASGIFFLYRYNRFPVPNAFIAAIFYLLLPFNYLLFSYQNGLKYLALSLLPWLLLSYIRLLNKQNLRNYFLTVIFLILIILTNPFSVLTIIICLFSLVFAFSRVDLKVIILKTILLIILSLSISTFWFTPHYWYILMANPSVGGIPLFNVVINTLNGLLQFLPLAVAVFTVKIKRHLKQGFKLFVFIYFISFTILSLMRFLANPAFVMDWTGFIPELQLGIAFLAGIYYKSIFKRKIIFNTAIVSALIFYGFIIFNLFSFIIPRYTSKEAYNNKAFKVLTEQIKENERVFLSGSLVFAINEKSDIRQVRGGNDPSSISPWWAHGAYQVREGKSSQLAAFWLQALGASYVFVHTPSSNETYHDFKNIGKYSDRRYFLLSNFSGGDKLYAVKKAYPARVVSSSLLKIKPLVNGDDIKTLVTYVDSIKQPVSLHFIKPDVIYFRSNLNDNELISLAITYHPGWRITKGNGILTKDILGNLVVIPTKPGRQEFVLSYSNNIFDILYPLFLTGVSIIALLFADKLLKALNRFTLPFHIGFSEKEDEY